MNGNHNGLDDLIEAAAEQAARRSECGNCAWFAVAKRADVGECHRYPPEITGRHAATTRDNVCGEFVHKKTGEGFRDHKTKWMQAIGERIDWLERRVAGL